MHIGVSVGVCASSTMVSALGAQAQTVQLVRNPDGTVTVQAVTSWTAQLTRLQDGSIRVEQ